MESTHSQKFDVVILEKENVRVNKPVFVAGFTTGGFVGSIAARHLVGFLEMNEIAHLESKLIPSPKMVVDSKLKTINPLQIYTKLQDNLMVLIDQTPPGTISPAIFWNIADALVNWLKEKDVREVIFLESSSAREEKIHEVYAYGADFQSLQELKKSGVKTLHQGLIGGIIASMIDKCIEQKIPWLVLLTTIKKPTEPDFHAAAIILDTLNKILRLQVDTKALKRIG
jgi:predicted ATP-grasp superfamily ATP-dependent carboligase